MTKPTPTPTQAAWCILPLLFYWFLAVGDPIGPPWLRGLSLIVAFGAILWHGKCIRQWEAERRALKFYVARCQAYETEAADVIARGKRAIDEYNNATRRAKRADN